MTHHQLIGCARLSDLPTPPLEQQNPRPEDCPKCGEPMWMSDKKRQLRADHGIPAMCMPCCLVEFEAQGETEVGALDLAKLNYTPTP